MVDRFIDWMKGHLALSSASSTGSSSTDDDGGNVVPNPWLDGEVFTKQRLAEASRVLIGDGGVEECVVDRGVYTRNRCFRLYRSSKFGKDAVLKINTDYTSYPYRPASKYLEPYRLLDTLASYVPKKVWDKLMAVKSIHLR